MRNKKLQILSALSLGIYCLTAPIAAHSTRTPTMAGLKGEPDIRAVQMATLKYFGLDAEEVNALRSKAAWKAILPVFEISGGAVSSTVDDKTTNINEYLDRPYVLRDVGGTAKEVGAQLTWNLPLLMFNPEELDVKTLASAREDIIKKVTDLYFERRKTQVMLALEPPSSESALMTKQLEVERTTALIDAMTGGWFSEKLH